MTRKNRHPRENRPRLTAAVVLLTLAAAATAVAPAAAEDEIDRLVGLMDTTRLVPMDEVVLPPESLAYNARRALRPNSVGPALAGESLEFIGQGRGRFFAVSPGFTYELRKDTLALLLLRKEGAVPGEPVPGGEPALAEDALRRLTDLGLSAGELKLVDSRRLVFQEQDEEGNLGDPTVAGYKEFVQRTIAGVPVLDSRAVVSYESDFRFEKALVHWPTLAAEGHRLTSTMQPDKIALTVAEALVAAGENDVTGSIPLRWVYEAIEDPDGRLRLELRVEATLLEPESPLEDDDVEKIRVRLFELPG